ncbi:SET domain-containing protein [Pseudozyma hubeiensis]|nr:SET domain-containing protein [Pseudozyma hubeiensis]
MAGAQPAQFSSADRINLLQNPSLAPSHTPQPCPQSLLNAEACRRKTSLSQPPKPSDKASLQVPSDWPNDVVYITQNLVAASVPEAIAQRYVLTPCCSSNSENTAGPSTPPSLPQATHDDGRPDTLYTASIQQQIPLAIRPIDELTPWCADSYHSTSRNLTCHPAAGSHGLFAVQEIPPDTFIRPYLGVLHTKADADFHSTYDLSLCHDPRLASAPSHSSKDVAEQIQALSLEQTQPDQHDATALYLDSRHWGNESRFVNDYRGISLKPNVEFRSFIQVQDGVERFQMGLFTTRLVRKGQELLINYGKSFWIHHDQLQAEKTSKKESASIPVKHLEKLAANAKPLDPIQAMLQRSRLRVSKTAPSNPRPPHQPHTRS